MNKEKTLLKIGQKITFDSDMEFGVALGEKKTVKKGTVAYVGFDGFLHYKDGMIQPISKADFEISGYDKDGIVDWCWRHICNFTPVDDSLLEEYDSNSDEFKKQMTYALDELGI